LVVALGSSFESQKSTTTFRPASPPCALSMAAHALITFTFFWNRPGLTGVSTSAMIATRIVVFVRPTSLPGATGPEIDELLELFVLLALPDAELLGAEPDEELADEQAASSAISASALAVMPRGRRRPARPANGRRPIPNVLYRGRELGSLFHFTMLRPHN
jgi:hypothetical protein